MCVCECTDILELVREYSIDLHSRRFLFIWFYASAVASVVVVQHGVDAVAATTGDINTIPIETISQHITVTFNLYSRHSASVNSIRARKKNSQFFLFEFLLLFLFLTNACSILTTFHGHCSACFLIQTFIIFSRSIFLYFANDTRNRNEIDLYYIWR